MGAVVRRVSPLDGPSISHHPIIKATESHREESHRHRLQDPGSSDQGLTADHDHDQGSRISGSIRSGSACCIVPSCIIPFGPLNSRLTGQHPVLLVIARLLVTSGDVFDFCCKPTG
jgi:hypothetical protein